MPVTQLGQQEIARMLMPTPTGAAGAKYNIGWIISYIECLTTQTDYTVHKRPLLGNTTELNIIDGLTLASGTISSIFGKITADFSWPHVVTGDGDVVRVYQLKINTQFYSADPLSTTNQENVAFKERVLPFTKSVSSWPTRYLVVIHIVRK